MICAFVRLDTLDGQTDGQTDGFAIRLSLARCLEWMLTETQSVKDEGGQCRLVAL